MTILNGSELERQEVSVSILLEERRELIELRKQNTALKKALAAVKEIHAIYEPSTSCVICRAIAEAEEVCGGS